MKITTEAYQLVDGFFFAPKKRKLMKFIRLKEVLNCIGISKSGLYGMLANGTFPKAVSLSGNSVAWVEVEVLAWIESRIQERDKRVEMKSKGGV
ncbi:MAG: prophage regulatory protein [Oleiphilaceae bacterium]|jgi:prophage regulatory protein